MCKIINFKVEHLDCMDMRSHEEQFNKDNFKPLEGELSFTGIIDGRIISCGGLKMYSQTGAEIWQIPSVYVGQYVLVYARYIKRWLNDSVQALGLNRVETVSIDDDLHNRWMLFLGFKKEGVKRKFLFNKDYAVWGRVWE
jgi:hypothetical protein